MKYIIVLSFIANDLYTEDYGIHHYVGFHKSDHVIIYVHSALPLNYSNRTYTFMITLLLQSAVMRAFFL